MNKFLYCVIFNQARGLLMVVAENSSSHQGASDVVGSPVVSAVLRLPIAGIKAISFAVLMLLGVTMTLLPTAQAQIIADPSAPKSQQPVVLNTANGLPQVNIQTPNAAGVSRNTYQQFDVQKGGAILNNARTDTQSQLGGWVQANPYLARGSARVIVNEINSSNPSHLRGFIEVAGARAQVVIANPAGISCDGCGFIHASRTTLTTGTPNFNNGDLDSYLVRGGRVSIDGSGLIDRHSDYTDIIARAVQVNAGIWSKALRVSTGLNLVNADNTQSTPETSAAASDNTAPRFAIDVAQLGGMYANKIFLVGTEAGVGMRSAGKIDAGVGEITITYAGCLENIGAISTPDRLQIQAESLRNSGSLQSQAEMTLSLQGDINNSGGSIQADRLAMSSIDGRLDNSQGLIIQIGLRELVITSASLSNQKSGTIDASIASSSKGGDAGSAANDVANKAARDVGKAGFIHAATTIINDGGRIVALGSRSVVTGTLNNDNGKLVLDQLQVSGDLLSNQDGKITLVKDFSTNVSDFKNRGGDFLVGGTFKLRGEYLDNTDGLIESTQLTAILAASLDNTSGILSQTGKSETQIQTGTVLTNQDGQIKTAGKLTLQTGSIAGDNGHLNVLGDLKLNSGSASIKVSHWKINGNATLNTSDLNNTSGNITAAGHLTITSAAGIINNAGQLQGNGNVKLTSDGALSNVAGHIEARAINHAASVFTIQTASIDNSKGALRNLGHGKTLMQSGMINNQHGTIASNGVLDLQATTLDNRAGEIIHIGTGINTIAVKQTLDNTGGIIRGNGNAARVGNTSDIDNIDNIDITHITANALTNDTGKISNAGHLTIKLDEGKFSNRQGILLAIDDVELKAASVDNTQGIVNALHGNLSITSTGVTTNDGGLLRAADKLTLTNAGLNNRLAAGADANNPTSYGRIGAGTITIDTQGQLLNNVGGTIVAKQLAKIDSAHFNNQAGLLQSGGDIAIDTHGATLTNTDAALYRHSDARYHAKGGIVAQGKLSLDAAQWNNTGGYFGSKDRLRADVGELVNAKGQVFSINNMDITASGAIDNDNGVIRSEAVTTLRGDSLTNKNTKRDIKNNTQGSNEGITGHNVDITAANINNDKGAIRAHQKISITSSGKLNNLAAHISAGEILEIQDGKAKGSRTLVINNQAGLLRAKRSLKAHAADLTGAGQVLSQANLSLTLDGHWNNQGQVTSSGDTDIAVSGDLNNTGSLRAGAALNLKARNIDNAVSGEMIGAQTKIIASDSVTNRGLIDGVDTRVDAATVNNIGSARLYGDTVSIAADNLTNTNEVVNGVNQAATIAARNRLDIGVVNILTNEEHALITSTGDMAIGGGVDMNRQAIGKAHTINNNSAAIESAGQLRMASTVLNNTNEHLQYQVVPQRKQVRDYVRANGMNIASQDVAHVLNMPGTGYGMGTGRLILVSAGITAEEMKIFTSWYDPQNTAALRAKVNAAIVDFSVWRDFTETTHQAQVTTSDPARITSGAAMTLNVDNTVLNDNSHILAGGALNVSGTAINNRALQVPVIYTRSGTSKDYGFIRKDRRGHLKKDRNIYGVRSAPYQVSVPVKIELSMARAEGNTAIGTSHAIAKRSTLNGTVNGNSSMEAMGSGSHRDAVFIDYVVTVPADSRVGHTTVAPSIVTKTNAIIRTSNTAVELPTTSLFQTNAAPSASYLIETDPRFTNSQQWLGSDYLLHAMNVDPALTQKRLGDAFYEQRILREQIAQLTGRHFLNGYSNDQTQYQALMNNAATFARQHTLRPGIALSAQQVAQLTSDIVWLVEKNVPLPDGSTQKVLAPQLYVRLRPGDLDSSGSLLSANDMQLNLSGDLTNSGKIAGRKVMQLRADNLHNIAGSISSDQLQIATVQDINNIGGNISAVSHLQAIAGRDFNIASTLRNGSSDVAQVQDIDRVAALYVTGTNGNLSAWAGRDLKLTAATISNDNGDKNGDTTLVAGRDLLMESLQQQDHTNISFDTQNYSRYGQKNDIGSQIKGSGKVQLIAGNALTANAATVQADGALTAIAGGNISITAGQSSQGLAQGFYGESSGWFSSSSYTHRTSQSSTQAQASNFGGDTIHMQAVRDINIVGSNIIGDKSTTLNAKGNLNLLAGINASAQSDYKKEEKSGIFSSGNFGITIGRQEQSQDQQSISTSSAASTVGNIQGDVNLIAGETYQQIGSDVLTPQGDINIKAKQINLLAARDTQSQTVVSKFKQSGLSLSISTPVLNAIQSIDQMSQAASKTRNTRMKVLAAGSAGLSAYNAYNKVAAGQGSRINGIDKQIATGKTNPDKTPETRDATALDKFGGIDLVASLGSSRSESRSVQQANQARGSTLSAVGNITISAIGDKTNSNILIEGGQLSAEKNIALIADNIVTLQAAQSSSTQRSRNKANSSSVGASIGSNGLVGNVAFSTSKGKGDGDDVSNTLTHLAAAENVSITSGSDSNVKGAVIAGQQVMMDVGNNFTIESVQDISRYEGRQQSIGGSFSFGAGKNIGSINLSRGKVDGSYASVIEQSGVLAGDGGFNIKVNGNTDLKGGKIASTEQAANNNKNSLITNTLTQSNIQNKDSYQAESTSASFGGGGSMGYGSSSSNASSVTESGISAGKVTIKDDAAQQAKTGKTAAETIASINTKVTEKDSSGKLSKDWNGQQLMEDVTAQAQIMQSFGSQAARAIGDYALKKENEIRGKLEKETDPQKQADLNAELKSWEEGGSNRVLLHTAAGALSGDLGGALGAAASAIAMPQISKQIAEMKLPEQVQKGLEQVTATALGAVVGGNNGAAVSLNVDANNRQLHQIEIDMIKKNAVRFAKKIYGTENPTQEQITGATSLLANTAQNLVDYNFGYSVPYSAQAEEFLHTLQSEYAVSNPNLSIGNGQFLFYATPDQMNSPYINSRHGDPSIANLMIKNPINKPSNGPIFSASNPYNPTNPCISAECIPQGKPGAGPDYLSVSANLYLFSGGGAINLYNGEMFGQWGLGRPYPGYSIKPGISIVTGEIIGGSNEYSTSIFLQGAGASGAIYYPIPVFPVIGVGGGINHSYGGQTSIEGGLSFPPGASVTPVGYGFEVNKKREK